VNESCCSCCSCVDKRKPQVYGLQSSTTASNDASSSVYTTLGACGAADDVVVEVEVDEELLLVISR